MDVAAELRVERARRRLNQEEAGEDLHVSVSTYRRWEAGEFLNIGATAIVRIARFIHKAPGEVVEAIAAVPGETE